mmetsp:Transcript_36278/g.145087  ORF Transcript_36278/g.145087 Transcript_36278/m.145087 type:complete len:105 (-) Transcript_36278:1502-1816(-)
MRYTAISLFSTNANRVILRILRRQRHDGEAVRVLAVWSCFAIVVCCVWAGLSQNHDVLAFYLERTGRNYFEAKSTGEELVLPSSEPLKTTQNLVMSASRDSALS